jgi:hypothetical protein
MPKLYQILLSKLGLNQQEFVKETEIPEKKVYNPVGAKILSSVSINEIDYKDRNFVVKEIHEYAVKFKDQKKQRFVDYVLLSRSIDSDDLYLKLRLMPSNNTIRAVLLEAYDDMPYNEDLHNILKDVDNDPNTPDFKLDDINAEYFRVNDEKEPYSATVKILSDENGDKKVESDEIVKEKIEFWDFGRTVEIDGVEEQELVFVELNTDNGYMRVWKGREISIDNVVIW